MMSLGDVPFGWSPGQFGRDWHLYFFLQDSFELRILLRTYERGGCATMLLGSAEKRPQVCVPFPPPDPPDDPFGSKPLQNRREALKNKPLEECR